MQKITGLISRDAYSVALLSDRGPGNALSAASIPMSETGRIPATKARTCQLKKADRNHRSEKETHKRLRSLQTVTLVTKKIPSVTGGE